MSAARRILVVDDERGFRDMLSWNLREDGVEVDSAADGREAEEKLRSGAYSLMLTDVTMPRLDGMRLLLQARKDFPSMPIIVMTGFGTVEMAVQAMKEGASDFVLKPFDMDGMLHRVKSLLGIPVDPAVSKEG